MSRSRTPAARLLRVAWVLFTAGVLAVAGWAVWLFVGTDQRAASQARAAVERFDAACSTAGEAGSDSATAAEVVGLVSFPGYDDQSWPVLAGTGSEQLATGIGWYPETMFKDGIKKTIAWYFEHEDWMKNVTSGDYQKYYSEMYE